MNKYKYRKRWMTALWAIWAVLSLSAQDSIRLVSFLHAGRNELIRGEMLEPVFRKIDACNSPVRILHLGDSHVRGHVFPVVVRRELEARWGSEAVDSQKITYHTTAWATETGRPGPVYHAKGINGALYAHFNTPEYLDQVKGLQPDLIILSFGTNEAHGANYTEDWQWAEMDSLILNLRQMCDSAVILLTTPPGSYLSRRVPLRRNGRTRYVTRKIPNAYTSRVVSTQLQYAETHRLPVWNLFEVAGGEDFACKNWRRAGLQRADHVHYTPEGYTLQGRLLAEAILKAYDTYELTR